MNSLLTPCLATATGFPWMNLVWVLLSIAALMLAIAAFGRWLAATHPDPVPVARRASPPPAAGATDSTEIAAVIAAAVHEALGPTATVTSVALQPEKPVSVENLMLAWSLEGRRQIYTSHKVR